MVMQIKLTVVVVVGRQLISASLNEETPFALRNPIMDDTKAMEPALEQAFQNKSCLSRRSLLFSEA